MVIQQILIFLKRRKNYIGDFVILEIYFKNFSEKVKSMFYHAYNGYLNYAYPKDELRPLVIFLLIFKNFFGICGLF